jgi:hypothetical protein
MQPKRKTPENRRQSSRRSMKVISSESGSSEAPKNMTSAVLKSSVSPGTTRESPKENSVMRSRLMRITDCLSSDIASTNSSSTDEILHFNEQTTDVKLTSQLKSVNSSNHLRNNDEASRRSVLIIKPLPQFVLDMIERIRLGIDDDDPEMRERFRRRIQSS